MRRFPATLLAVALLTATAGHASAAAPAPAPNGRFGVRLLDIPVAEADDSRARQYIVDHLLPGSVIHRRIEVSTTSRSVLHTAVYPDAAVIAHGSFIGAAGHTANDLTTWTSVSSGALDVPAHGRVTDTVTISVPQDAAPGERYGVVWVEAAEADPGSITLVARVGIRIYLDIGGDNPPAPDFTVDTLTARRNPQGRPIVEAMVHNTGGRALDLSGALTLVGVPDRLTAGPYGVQLGTTLAPGQSEPVRTVLTDQVPDGPWTATVELRSGLLDKSYRARIVFPHGPGVAAAAAAQPVGRAGHPGLIAGGVLGSLVLGALAVPAARRRRRGRATRGEG